MTDFEKQLAARVVEAPLTMHRDVVRPEWIDKNGHMTFSAYATAFTLASDKFLEYVGLSFNYTALTGYASYALKWQISFLRETFEGVALRFETQLIDFTPKVYHHVTCMYDDGDGALLATAENLDSSADAAARRIAAMPAAHLALFERLMDAHRDLPLPPGVGEGIAVKRR